MDGALVVFPLPAGSPPAAHKAFRRALYGEDPSSWGGRYASRRRGLLDDVPHARLYWGVVILRREDAPRLLAAVRRNGGTAVSRTVRLTGADRKAPSSPPPLVCSQARCAPYPKGRS